MPPSILAAKPSPSLSGATGGCLLLSHRTLALDRATMEIFELVGRSLLGFLFCVSKIQEFWLFGTLYRVHHLGEIRRLQSPPSPSGEDRSNGDLGAMIPTESSHNTDNVDVRSPTGYFLCPDFKTKSEASNATEQCR